MAGAAWDGVTMPVLVLDASRMPTLREAIDASRYEPDGDVQIVWASHAKLRRQALQVTLIRPVPFEFYIAFDVPKHALLIDGILQARGFFLKAGEPGVTLQGSMRLPALHIDVPETPFNSEWYSILIKALVDDFRKKGSSIKEARIQAESAFEKLREITSFRFKFASGSTKD